MTQSFPNDATSGSANFPGDGTTGTVKPVTLTIRYDASAKSYTLTVGSRSLTFKASDVDATQTNSAVTVYVRKNGDVTDTLTLTNPATSGRFTYQYVGGAFWQRTDLSGTPSGSMDAVAYGIETPSAAVPRTGVASYDVDLIGYETMESGVRGNTGQGKMDVDFASGNIVTNATLDSWMGTVPFYSVAKMSGTSNTFTGTFQYGIPDNVKGSISGRFYGPHAEEVGAAYSASTPDGSIAGGVILGRKAGTLTADTQMDTLTQSQFLAGTNAARVSYTQNGALTMNASTSGRSTVREVVAVHYDAATKTYTLIAPDRNAYFAGVAAGDTTTHVAGMTSSDDLVIHHNGLKYVAALQWAHVQNGLDQNYGHDGETVENLAVGFLTPDSAVPRTGAASYALHFYGQAVDPDYQNRMNLTGMGALNADFLLGKIDFSGHLDLKEDWIMAGRPPATATSKITGSGTLSSTANAFNGSVALDTIGDYSGSFAGSFFGPHADELGVTFTATDSAGGVAAGVFIGNEDPNAGQSTGEEVAMLTSISKPTSFGASITEAPNITPATLDYDPSTSNYLFHTADHNGNPTEWAFGPADIVASKSNASQTYYERVQGNGTISGYLFKPGSTNPTLALSYVSFGDLTAKWDLINYKGTDRWFMTYGSQTPATVLPRSGTASYTGIVVGAGSTNVASFDISGTSHFTADFAAESFKGTLELFSKVPGSTDAPTLLGDFDYGATINSANSIWGGLTGNSHPGLSGQISGRFYGPNAEEFGANWTLFRSDGDLLQAGGVTVGKQN